MVVDGTCCDGCWMEVLGWLLMEAFRLVVGGRC